MRRVVVTGMGAITPIGNSVETFWNSLKENKVGIGLLDRFEEYCSAAQKDIDLADGHEVFTAIHRQISHSLDNAITGLSCWVAELENMQEKHETGLLQHKEADDLTLSM